jgi:hypothetical protein
MTSSILQSITRTAEEMQPILASNSLQQPLFHTVQVCGGPTVFCGDVQNVYLLILLTLDNTNGNVT